MTDVPVVTSLPPRPLRAIPPRRTSHGGHSRHATGHAYPRRSRDAATWAGHCVAPAPHRAGPHCLASMCGGGASPHSTMTTVDSGAGERYGGVGGQCPSPRARGPQNCPPPKHTYSAVARQPRIPMLPRSLVTCCAVPGAPANIVAPGAVASVSAPGSPHPPPAPPLWTGGCTVSPLHSHPPARPPDRPTDPCLLRTLPPLPRSDSPTNLAGAGRWCTADGATASPAVVAIRFCA